MVRFEHLLSFCSVLSFHFFLSTFSFCIDEFGCPIMTATSLGKNGVNDLARCSRKVIRESIPRGSFSTKFSFYCVFVCLCFWFWFFVAADQQICSHRCGLVVNGVYFIVLRISIRTLLWWTFGCDWRCKENETNWFFCWLYMYIIIIISNCSVTQLKLHSTVKIVVCIISNFSKGCLFVCFFLKNCLLAVQSILATLARIGLEN